MKSVSFERGLRWSHLIFEPHDVLDIHFVLAKVAVTVDQLGK